MRRLKCEKETIILTNEDDGFYDVYAASWKDISGKSIRYDETESKWNSCNLTWF